MGEVEILPMVCPDGREYPELCVVENIESGRVKRLRVALKVAPQIINSRDKFFRTTPLMIAANSIQLDAAKCLIEMGALLDLRDNGGKENLTSDHLVREYLKVVFRSPKPLILINEQVSMPWFGQFGRVPSS
mmetsp:Transcript_21126/g.29612  ORF Transcript_21126/g.29612 Transcript_21126/m.29612 type:complete len:132 (-) Transcript_21126:759-1154(-)